MPTAQTQTEDEDIIILWDESDESENQTITMEQTEDKKEENNPLLDQIGEEGNALLFGNTELSEEKNKTEDAPDILGDSQKINKGDSVFDFLWGDEKKEISDSEEASSSIDIQIDNTNTQDESESKENDNFDFLWDSQEEKEEIIWEDSSKSDSINDSILDTFAVWSSQSSWAQDDSSSWDMNTILEETIQKLKARQEVIASTKDEKNNEVDTRNEKIKNLKNEVADLRKEIKDLETEDEKIQANVEGLEKMKLGSTTSSEVKRTPRRKVA